jgi:hypothetical protein
VAIAVTQSMKATWHRERAKQEACIAKLRVENDTLKQWTEGEHADM